MMRTNGSKTGWLLAGIVAILLPTAMAQASQDQMLEQIRAFSACAQGCVDQNVACEKKLSKQCKGKGDKCYSVCKQAHPKCMAKCPVPTSGK